MQKDAEQLLVDKIYELRNDFHKLVLFLFPWGEKGTPLEGKTLRKWQKEYLISVSDHIKKNGFNGREAVPPIKKSTGSGHGIGKSALASMLTYCIMSSRPLSRGTITANTYQQLRTKTFSEISKWHNMAINKHWFEFSGSALRLCAKDETLKDTWYVQGQTCREENSESFAGQHVIDSTSWYLFDEASGIPNIIWEVAEGGLTEGEPMWFVFGNTTKNTGKFRETFRKDRKYWETQQIDSRTVEGTNKEYLDELVDRYGEDSDVVRYRVKGLFPKQSADQFISEQLVEASLNLVLEKKKYDFSPTIISCDPAWTGDDDLVISKRQGLHYKILEVIPYNDDDTVIGNKIAIYEDEFNADAVFIDIGYGTGIISFGKLIGRTWIGVHFGGKSDNIGYKNKRAEMWGGIKQWLKDGGKIEPHDQILDDLTGVQTVPQSDGKILLESKKDMKKRGLPSPNTADALALTFAFPVSNVKPKPIIEHDWMS